MNQIYYLTLILLLPIMKIKKYNGEWSILICNIFDFKLEIVMWTHQI